MSKWPKVPAVYGWLSLDRRGRWLIGGQRLSHQPTIDFINRNYQADAAGYWYFQNGPQRVFVDLAYTPWVYGLGPSGGLVTHTGSRVTDLHRALLDEDGNLVMVTGRGPGLLDDRDLATLGDAFYDRQGRILDEAGFDRLMKPGRCRQPGLTLRVDSVELGVYFIASSDMARRFGFVAHPQAR